MRSEDLVRGVVRIWSEGEHSAIVGTGVVVAPGLVLTCAHVVARAWGEDPDLEEGLARTVRLDLPAGGPAIWHDATVVLWLPRRPAPGGAYDLAGLRFSPPPGDAGVPLPLVIDDAMWGKPCRVFGFPAGRPDGSYAGGVLRDVLANGWASVKGGAEAREFTRPGFSGGPVVTEAGVVGILTEGDSDVRVREAVMIPVRTILAAWPELHRRLGRSPFPGLAAFTPADAPYFHGRTAAVQEIAAALTTAPHLLVLAGPSGSGKSSLLAAGVLPRLVAGAPPGATPWHALIWVPRAAPFAEFARSLLRTQHPAADDVRLSVEAARLAADLERGRVTLADVLAQDPDARWAFVIDQSEELVLQGDEAEPWTAPGHRLLGALLAAHGDARLVGRVAIALAVRTDFLDALLRHPSLVGRADGDVVRYLGAVDDLREVIEGPLREAGVARLETGLADRLLAEVADVPNPLPLLQFTLAELWAAQQAGRLTHAAYDALGGVRRALANRAERVVEGFDVAEMAAVREVMLQLGRPAAGDLVARRAARFDELGERGRLVVPLLADARLVVTDRDGAGVERVEVVHEALFDHWPRLRAWWREAADFRRWQEGVRDAVRAWREGGEHPSDLLQGPRLRAAEAYLRERPGTFAPAELSFVAKSSEREQEAADVARRTLRRELGFRRRMNVLLGIGLLAALALATATAWQTSSAHRLRADAERLLHATTSANAALARLTADLEGSLGDSRAVLARQLGVEAVAMASDPRTFGGDLRLAALMAAHAVRLDPGPATHDHLLQVLQAHPTYRATFATHATAVALAPDGRTVILGDARGGVSRWDAFTGAPQGRRVEGHVGRVTALALARDGRTVVSGGADGRLIVWDASTLRRIGAFQDAHPGPISAVASVAGPAWLSADVAGSVRVWDAASRVAIAGLERAASPAQAVLTGNAAAPGRDAGIPVASAAIDGLDRWAAEGHAAWSALLTVDPAGTAVALPLGDAIVVLDASTLTVTWRIPDAAWDLAGLSFTSDGDRLVAATRSGSMIAWPVTQRGAAAERWTLPTAPARALAAGGDGRRVLVASSDGSSRWFDLELGALVGESLRGHAEAITSIVVGAEILVSLSSDGRAVAWDRAPRRALGMALGSGSWAPHALLVEPSGGNVVVGGLAGTLTRLSLADGSVSAHVTAHGEGVTAAAHGADGLVTVGRDGHLVARDPATLEPIATLWSHTALLWSVVSDPGAEAWLTGGVHGVVVRVPWREGVPQTVRAPTRLWSPGAVVALGPGGSTRALALAQEVELWHDDARVARIREPTGAPVLTLAFDPTGARLVGASSGGTTLWQVPSLDQVAYWPGAKAAAYDPTGALIALGDHAGLIHLLDAATLATIGPPLRGHDHGISRLTFSPDGRHLVSVDDVGEVWRWSTDPKVWLSLVCALAWHDLEPHEVAPILSEAPFEPVCEIAGG